MGKLTWDDRTYEDGIDKSVLYLLNKAVPWNGLVSIDENDSGEVDTTTHYYDGQRRRLTLDAGNYSATINAFTYPEEFYEYDGYNSHLDNQARKLFGFTYRTNDGDGYKIHIVYNAVANPSSRANKTLDASSNPSVFTWDISTTPEPFKWTRPGTHLVISSNTVRYQQPLDILESWLYGTVFADARLPSPDEIEELFESYTVMRISYNGDGTWTAAGPDDMVHLLNVNTFEIQTESAYYILDYAYTVNSY